MMMCK